MSDFDGLSPAVIRAAVEQWTGFEFDGTLVPFGSYINRVYGLRDAEGTGWVVKFYRPDRWSGAAIDEEHQFLRDAAQAEIPVALPWADETGETRGELVWTAAGREREASFAVFLQRGGRTFEAEQPDDWRRLGSLLGRLHAVSRQRTFAHRVTLSPRETFLVQAQLLAPLLPSRRESAWADVVLSAVPELEARWGRVNPLRLHGDVHRGNLLDRGAEGLLVMDFDDCAMGPPVQDLWLLLSGSAADSGREMDWLTQGYSQFSPSDQLDWSLVESLRLMRMVHFLSWVARQRADASFERNFPDWGTDQYWDRELRDLAEQRERMSQ